MKTPNIDQWAVTDRLIRRVCTAKKADFGRRFFSIARATGVEGALWAPFQIAHMNSTSTFSSTNKSRQIGFSFIAAGDAVFDGLLRTRHTVVSVSYNLEEAKEKILYARAWWNSRHRQPWQVPMRGEFDEQGNHRGSSPNRLERWPELIVDNQLELAWSNGFRMISHPCRPPRGKQATVLLDEFAHYQNAGSIYTAAVPMITRGIGGQNRIVIGSTPLGASGRFWEIHANEDKFPDYERYDFAWWELFELCTDILAARAAYIEGRSHEEIVERFGSKKLKTLCDNVIWEDFLQEYCLSFLDSIHAFLTWDLIKSCYPDELRDFTERGLIGGDAEFSEDILVAGEHFDPEAVIRDYGQAYFHVKARCSQGQPDNAIDAFVKLRRAIDLGLVSGELCWAYDCGRERDAAEICIMEYVNGKRKQRAMITMPQMPFLAQREVIDSMMEMLPSITRGYMDKGGIGMEISEWARGRFGMKCQPITFTNPRKEMWAKQLKLDMEGRKIVLIPDREQEHQLHSIRRKVTDSKNFQYVVEEDSVSIAGKKVQHHADKFWVVALANFACAQLDSLAGHPQGGTPNETATEAQAGAKAIAVKGFKTARSVTGSSRAAGAVSRVGRKMGR